MISVQRSSWKQEHLALICGIANAGGGALTITEEKNSQLFHTRKAHRFFDNVITLTQENLGLACTTEPVMINGQLATEIIIPAVTEPKRYNGKYYMWRHNENDVVTRDEAMAVVTERSKQQRAADLGNTVVVAAEAPAHEAVGADAVASKALPQNTASATEPATATESIKFNDTTSGVTTPKLIVPTSDEPGAAFTEKSIAAANDLDLTAVDEYVIKVLTVNGRATAVKIADYLGVSESTVHRSYKKLRGLGIIRRIGSTKAGYWKVLI